MKLFALLIAFTLPFLATAQDWAKERLDKSNRHQEWVEVKNGDRVVKTFVVYPEVKDKAPVVVLIHEIFGASDWFMLQADELAAAGFIAVAPDLLSGMGPNGGRTIDFADRSKITEAISGLNPDQVTGDLNAACDYAKTISSSNGKTMVAGFCWGGAQTFRFATNRSDITAAFVFYGTPPAAEAMKTIACPVYGFYGGNDNRVNATIEDAKKAMSDAGKTYEPVIYDGAGHGFMRAGDDPAGTAENKKAKEDATRRLVELIKKHGG